MSDNSELNKIVVDALENISEAFVIYDRDGYLVACNKNFRDLYNYSESESAPGVHFKQLGRLDIERGNVVIGDDFGDGEEYLARRAAYREKLEGSFTVHLKDGRWIRTTDRQTPEGGFVSIQADITDHRQLEEENLHARERFKAAFQTNRLRCAILVFETGKYLDVNAAWEATYGLTRQEVIGKRSVDIGIWVDLEERKRVLSGLKKAGDRIEFETMFYTKSRKLIIAVTTAELVVVSGQLCIFLSGEDITKQRDMEEELSHASNILKTAFNTNSSMCAITALETSKFIDVNEAWLETTGYRREEVIGKTALELDVWGSPENRNNIVDIIKNKKQVGDYESWIQTKDGQRRDIIFKADILKVSDIECLFFSAVDITNQKRYEKEIELSEHRFRSLFKTAPIGMAVYDTEADKHLLANPRYLEIVGRNMEEMNDFEWSSITHPDDLEEDLALLQKMKKGEINGYDMVKRYVYKDGSICWVDMSIVGIDNWDESGRHHHLSMISDITQKKETEQALQDSNDRFKDFTAASADWYWETDAALRIIYVSTLFEDGSGLDSNNVIGRTLEETMKDFSIIQPNALDYQIQCHKDRQSYRDIVYCRVNKTTGEKVWIRTSGVPTFDTRDDFIGFRGSASNVTHLMELEEKLKQSQKMEAVGQLTGGIAHDFNNLLAVIQGNVELLKEDLENSDESTIKKLNAVMKATQRGAELTQSMLAFSRRQDLRPSIIQLDQQVNGMIDMLRRTLGEWITIETHFDDTPWPCSADSGKVENALLNLAINARDAMPDGGGLDITVKNAVLDEDYVSSRSDVEPGDYVMLSVADTGIGMTEDQCNHAFEPFFTTKEVGKGTGLGLSMVYGFAMQSKGHVEIHSVINKGTTVSLYLPRSP